MPRYIGSSIDGSWNETVGGAKLVAAGETSRFIIFNRVVASATIRKRT